MVEYDGGYPAPGLHAASPLRGVYCLVLINIYSLLTFTSVTYPKVLWPPLPPPGLGGVADRMRTLSGRRPCPW